MEANIDGIPRCQMCGGQMVRIRGRFPTDDKRTVCPTCLADRLDNIREISSPEYGKSYSAQPVKPTI